MTVIRHHDLSTRVSHAAQALRIEAGAIVPLRGIGTARHASAESGRAPATTEDEVAKMLAVHSVGGVPLACDDRSGVELLAQVRRVCTAAATEGAAGWATLTSGSTGTPRIVLRTTESWSRSFETVAALLDLTTEDAFYLPSPVASSLTSFSIAHAYSAGIDLVLPRAGTPAASGLTDGTLFHGTPRALRNAVEAIEDGAPSGIRAALVGGADLDASVRARAEALGIRVIAYYGAAELSFVAIDTGEGLRPFPGVEIELRQGELWVRSAFVSSGYLSGNGPMRQDADGWSTVGDRAEWVGTGGRSLRLRGRADDAILTAAATVVPADVEAALRALDGVADAVVFGTPNAGIGTLVCAVIEIDDARRLPPSSTLRSQASARLLRPQIPRRWFVTPELPRTHTGKPARAEVMRRAAAGELSRLE